MMTPRACLLGLLVLASTAAAQTPVIPEPGPGDPRIRTVVYDRHSVVLLRGHLGYQIMVEFDPDERIENVSIGDSLAWQVTPNRKATRLFLKPMERGAATNMTVVTNRRTYAFELAASEAMGPDDPRIMFGVRFLYPDEAAPQVIEIPPPPPPEPAAPAQPTPEDYNFAYAFSGSKALIPLRVFDDGAATYFHLRPDDDAPALFVIGPSGEEELINTRIAGRYVVVDRIAQRFVLRYGRSRTLVTNEAYAPASPPERSASAGREG